MSDQLNADRVLLVGAGGMAREYARVLTALERPMLVVGRGVGSAAAFEAATGTTVGTGPLSTQLDALDSIPETAIVAVNAMFLTDVAVELAEAGVRRLLLEKPGALDEDELERLVAAAERTGAEMRIGYNRRFMPSVRQARRMVGEDGGVVSVKFDFSEPSRRIATLGKPERELSTWFYGNSSHVVDLGLHFAGACDEVVGLVAGRVSWHPDAGVFVGSARSATGALLSWHANWVGPGRWGLEVMTAERRLIMQPLEQLRVQTHDSFDESPVDLGEPDGFKPGLLDQVRAFLDGVDADLLPTLAEHVTSFSTFEAIRTGRPPKERDR